MNEKCKLEKEECLELRKRLQKARYQVLEDGENWLGIAQAIEAVAKALAKKYKVNQREQKKVLLKFVNRDHPTIGRGQKDIGEGPFRSTFETLLKEVINARNDEAHTGAAARSATRIATAVGIYLEDTLMAYLEDTLMAASDTGQDGVKAYIQEEVVRAYTWQMLGECRRLMLAHSFSFLPLLREGKWEILTDANLAKYLAATEKKEDRRKETVEDAINKKDGKLKVVKAAEVKPCYTKQEALNEMDGKAAVVLDKKKELVGIITPFDLL